MEAPTGRKGKHMPTRTRSSRTLWIGVSAALGALAAAPLAGCGGSSAVTFSTSSGSSSSGGGGGQGGQGGASSSSSSSGNTGPACGNGVLEGKEECDDGNLTSGDGCDNDCSFTCVAGDPTRDHCDDGNACNGVETCGADHACAPGEPLAEGADCGAGKICVGGNCVDGSCGDAIVTAPEECDDGNAAAGDGCEGTCKFTCLSTDPARNCASQNPCVGNGKCDDTTHVCAAGAPLTDGTACGSAQICVGSACVAEQCGDGFLGAGEQCDFGVGANLTGSGCEPTCAFSCATNTGCSDNNPCNGVETCAQVTGPNGTAGKKCAPGTPLADGTACGGGKVCKAGVCTTPTAACGNGVIETGEACDLGAQNGTGAGCSSTCQLDCATDANCADGNACNGAETCVNATVNGQVVKKCQAGANLAKCAACAGGLCNGSGACVASTCGDGCVDAAKGETCDPPSGTTCSATCQSSAVCGNGVLEAGEQCDDGNLYNLDGCDSACKYEVVTRMTSIAISGALAPASCTPTTNRLGRQSLTGTGLSSINDSLKSGVDDGSTNVLTQILGLDDLTGVADSNGFSIGVLAGSLDPAKGAWPNNNPIDWWFLADRTTVSMGLPTGLLTNGTLAARQFAAGPNDVNLALLLAGSPAILKMRSARVAGTLNGTPAPNVPAPPPAQLAAGLTVFQTITATGAAQGLCGNITVESLAQIPAPESLSMGGSTACGACPGSKQYTYCGANQPVGANCNSLLDVLVGGCKVVACFVTAINAQQPDVSGTDGDIDTLTLGTGNKVPQNLVTGNDDAYSAYLTFTANRAHLTGQTCAAASDCQTGKACLNGTCQ